MIDFKVLTIEEAHELLASKKMSVRDLVLGVLSCAQEKNKELNIYIEFFDEIESQIDAAQKRFDSGTATTLTGIPCALKDNILLKGFKASAGSKILENYTATYDADVVSLLKKHNVIFLGRTNMDEFAMGSSTETSYYGVTKNPFDSARVAGGSSGGAAAAVATGGAIFSLGSDTGGSIRQPAAFCGTVGLKPTYGTISRSGLMAMGSSLDIIGSFTKSVADTKIIFEILSRTDALDATSIPDAMRTGKGIQKKKIGIPKNFLSGEGIDSEVLKNFEKSKQIMQDAGYELVDVDLPLTPYSLAVYYILMPAESSTNLARHDGIRYGYQSKEAEDLLSVYMKSRGEGFGREVRRRIMLGTYVLSHGYYDAYYNKAVLLRKKIAEELDAVFQEVDALMTPTTPSPAFKIGEKTTDPVSMYLSDIFTVSANIAGVPAISVPSGFTESGLPLGIQFISDNYNESALFELGEIIENKR